MYVLATPYLNAEYKQTELTEHQQIKTTLSRCTYVHALEQAKKAPSKLAASCGFTIHSELRGNRIARLHVNSRPSNGTTLFTTTHVPTSRKHWNTPDENTFRRRAAFRAISATMTPASQTTTYRKHLACMATTALLPLYGRRPKTFENHLIPKTGLGNIRLGAHLLVYMTLSRQVRAAGAFVGSQDVSARLNRNSGAQDVMPPER
jgi:hypothetical protein